jgi:hypothetical protein
MLQYLQCRVSATLCIQLNVKHISCCMRLTHICVNAERVSGKNTPALEIIAHSRLNRNATLPVNWALHILGNIFLGHQDRLLAANLTVGFLALLYAAEKDCS